MKRVIHWFRRDLRLSDNTALSEADRRAERVIPVFVLEDALQTGPDVGAARLTFLLRSVESAARKPLAKIGSEPLPIASEAFGHALAQSIPEPGERAARNALKRFLAGPVYEYVERRNRPDLEGTSGLSPYLRSGTIGPREIYERLSAARADGKASDARPCDVWLSELIWREFYLQILNNFPHVARGAFNRKYDPLEWSDDEAHFQAWCHGQTGYPLADAAMRCLNATAAMHNRLRMIVAMFLTKDLLINWRRGERYFMQKLVDGDMAANNGGWQWSAGTGTDAAPYFGFSIRYPRGQSSIRMALLFDAGCRNSPTFRATGSTSRGSGRWMATPDDTRRASCVTRNSERSAWPCFRR